MREYLIPKIKDRRKTPVLACGFVAYLINYFGDETKKIYENYFKLRLNEYKTKHKNAPDAFKRDFEKEFFDVHLSKEEEMIGQSEAIFEFISDDEVNIIKQYISNYIEYVKKHSDPLYIVEYNKESEIIADNDQRINLAYKIFLNYPETSDRYNLVARINDVRRIILHHNEKPDECLRFVLNKYQTAFNIGTVFIECLKRILDVHSVFIKLLKEQPIELNKATQIEVGNFIGKYSDLNIEPTVKGKSFKKEQREEKSNSDEKDTDIYSSENINTLEIYFFPKFRGKPHGLNQFRNLIEELKTERSAKEVAQIAHIIYTNPNLLNSRKPKTFTKWHKLFCQLLGLKYSVHYKPNKLIPYEVSLKSLFSYLFDEYR